MTYGSFNDEKNDRINTATKIESLTQEVDELDDKVWLLENTLKDRVFELEVNQDPETYESLRKNFVSVCGSFHRVNRFDADMRTAYFVIEENIYVDVICKPGTYEASVSIEGFKLKLINDD